MVSRCCTGRLRSSASTRARIAAIIAAVIAAVWVAEIAGGADQDGHALARLLGEGLIEFRHGLRIEPILLNVSGYADDFEFGAVAIGAANLDAVTEGGLAGPPEAGEGLVDDGDLGPAGAIGIVEIAAADGNAHHGKVAGFGDIEERDRHIAARGSGAAGDGIEPIAAVAAAGRSVHGTGRGHPGDGTQALEQAGVEGGNGFRSPVGTRRKLQFERQEVLRLEAGAGVLRGKQAAQEEAGAKREDERERHFPDDEKVAEGLTVPAAAGETPAFFEGAGEIEFAGEDHRREAGGQSRGECDGGSKEQDRKIEGDLRESRNIGRREVDQQAEARLCQRDAGEAADQGDHGGFGEQLSHEAQLAGADGFAEGQFAGARTVAGKQEARHVGGGNQQDQRGRAHQDPQRSANLLRAVLGPKAAVAAVVVFGARVGFGQAAHDGVEVRVRGSQGDARPQASERTNGAVLGAIDGSSRGAAEREIVVDFPGLPERRGHTGNLKGSAIEDERGADDVGVAAELARPEAVAEDDHRGRARTIVLGIEEAAQKGTHSRVGRNRARWR